MRECVLLRVMADRESMGIVETRDDRDNLLPVGEAVLAVGVRESYTFMGICVGVAVLVNDQREDL